MASTGVSTKAAFNFSNKDCSASVHTHLECDPVRLVRDVSNVSIASYKISILVGEAEELLNLFLGLMLRTTCKGLLFSED